MAVSIETLLETADKSIRFPHSAMQIALLAQSEKANNETVSKSIEQDPAFSAQLLKVVNSPLFGLANPIGSISDAISQIGRQGIADLALLQGSAGAFNKIESSLMRATTFWEHSRLVAALAREIATETGQSAQLVFMAGLLHDIGLLLMFHQYPIVMEQVLEHSLDQGVDLSESEQAHFGFDHATLGGELAQLWRLPEELGTAISHHHRPWNAERHEATVACVALANETASDQELAMPSTLAALAHLEQLLDIEQLPIYDLLDRSLGTAKKLAIG